MRRGKFTVQYADSQLSYFHKIIKIKLPNTNASVTLIQEMESVTIKITSNENSRESIMNEFLLYGLAVFGHIPHDSYLSSRGEVDSLKLQLEVAKMHLRSSNILLGNQQVRIEELLIKMESMFTKNNALLEDLRKYIQDQFNAIKSRLFNNINFIQNSADDPLEISKIKNALMDDIEKALSLLSKCIKEGTPEFNDLILLKSNHNMVQKNYNNLSINFDDYVINMTKLTKATLVLVQKIEGNNSSDWLDIP